MQRLPAGEQFEVGQRYCDLGLVIGVPELVGVLPMQFLSEAFVRVDLEREGFAKGEDLLSSVGNWTPEVSYLWQVRDLRTVSIQHRFTDELRILLQIVREQFTC